MKNPEIRCKMQGSSRAFTLIEALVAVTILTVAIAGPLFSAGRAIIAAGVARDQLTASYLAQEGIEYIRMLRDNNYLSAYQGNSSTASSVGWTSFLASVNQCNATANPTVSCTLDPVNNALPLTVFSGNAPLHLTNCVNGPSGLSCTPPSIYTQQNISGSIQTSFTRTLQIIDTLSTNDKKIVSKVSWSFHGIPYSVTITDHLTPWQ
ncbi:MAG: prepilin-type N-terminal cleavage/methylation domain-containing protein [bacterium]